MLRAEDDSGDEIGKREIGGERHRRGELEHGFVKKRVDDAAVDERGDDRRSECCDDRQQRTPPRVEHPARYRRFDHLLGHHGEEEHHGDVVDGERDRKSSAVVALGRDIDPGQGNERAEREQKQVLEREL